MYDPENTIDANSKKKEQKVTLRLSLFTLLLGIAAMIGIAFVGYFYLEQRSNKALLDAALTEAEASLLTYGTAVEIALDMAEQEANLATARSFFHEVMTSSQITNIIVDLEIANGVDIGNVDIGKTVIEAHGKHEYHTVSVTLDVDGDFDDILDFLTAVTDGPFKSVVINDVDLSGLGQSPTAIMDFTIYMIDV